MVKFVVVFQQVNCVILVFNGQYWTKFRYTLIWRFYILSHSTVSELRKPNKTLVILSMLSRVQNLL